MPERSDDFPGHAGTFAHGALEEWCRVRRFLTDGPTAGAGRAVLKYERVVGGWAAIVRLYFPRVPRKVDPPSDCGLLLVEDPHRRSNVLELSREQPIERSEGG